MLRAGLPRRFFELATQDLPRCKLLLVIGTSLSVQPFAQLVGHVPENCVRCLVNRDAVGRRDPRIPIAVARHLGSGSLDYGNAANYRDVALLGACDDGIRSLAASLGWADDLDRLVASATALFAARAPPPPPELPPPRQLSASELASIGDLLVDDDDANAAPVVFE